MSDEATSRKSNKKKDFFEYFKISALFAFKCKFVLIKATFFKKEQKYEYIDDIDC
jgi:hypothetical protein